MKVDRDIEAFVETLQWVCGDTFDTNISNVTELAKETGWSIRQVRIAICMLAARGHIRALPRPPHKPKRWVIVAAKEKAA